MHMHCIAAMANVSPQQHYTSQCNLTIVCTFVSSLTASTLWFLFLLNSKLLSILAIVILIVNVMGKE